ncbi:MAG: sigma-70 family RNA polymerase sigma factor [Planctomycetota bacterium]|nr:sigma-70 family RNA polymerase sigma factor [Planctomycetota bacterium]
MNGTGSVSVMLHQLQSDETHKREAACEYLWRRYSKKLLDFACRRLNHHVRRRVDEHDVVSDVFLSLWQLQRCGGQDLNDRQELWKMLVTITLRRISNVVKFQRRARRDYRRELRIEGSAEFDAGLLSCVPSRELAPETRALVKDELEKLMGQLPPQLRQIAVWKIAGFTNAEIARSDKLGCSVRTVERKLNEIRTLWCEFA